jgi:predicted Zn-dependent protease
MGAMHTARALVLALALTGAAAQGFAAEAPRPFTGFTSAEDEIAVGRAERPAILAQYGGEAGTSRLQRYVAGLGDLVVRTVDRKDIPYSFTVLNSPVVNAFATPGGFIYVTRGLVELADSEAELAAVLAHELGHLAALHRARPDDRIVRNNILLAGLGAGHSGDELGHVLVAGALQSFSADDEREADALAIRYLSRTGHDVAALPRFLGKLRARAAVQAEMRGEKPGTADPFDYLANHPAPDDRIARAAELADKAEQSSGERGHDGYLDQIDGLAFGDEPSRGVINGRVFAHPVERIRFEVPRGYFLFALPHGVAAFGPRGARILFDTARTNDDTTARLYLVEQWSDDASLSRVETIDIAGLDAATGIARGRADTGEADVRLVAIKGGHGVFHRFVFATPIAATAALATELRRTTYSFRRLSEGEARALKPQILHVVAVGPADTVDSLSARMPFGAHKRERFAVLNGLSPDGRIAAGMRVKLVTE